MTRPNFKNVAEIGDRIRAYDFQPIPGRVEYFIEGEVIDKSFNQNCHCFVVLCDVDTSDTLCENNTARKGENVYVPFGTLMDWEGRVIKI